MTQKLTIAQVADQFGVSAKTVRRYIAAGSLTAYRIGPRLIRIDAEEAHEELLGKPINKHR